jgi:hypothetical protein
MLSKLDKKNVTDKKKYKNVCQAPDNFRLGIKRVVANILDKVESQNKRQI